MDNQSYDVYELCLVHTQFDRWVRSQISQALDGTELTMMEWLLLVSINKNQDEELSVTEAAELLGVSLPQVTALTQQLVKKDLISLEVESEDRRSRRLRISSRGQVLCTTALRHIEEAVEEDMKDSTQLKTYRRLLSAMVDRSSEPARVD